jgi:hypothetical protein
VVANSDMDTTEPPDYFMPSFFSYRKELSKSREDKTIKKNRREGPTYQESYSEMA